MISVDHALNYNRIVVALTNIIFQLHCHDYDGKGDTQRLGSKGYGV